MAGRAEIVLPTEIPPGPPVPVAPDNPNGHTAVEEMHTDAVQLAAAQLYGQGFSRRQVFLKLLEHLAPKEREGKRDRTREEQEQVARAKLRRWEKQEKFRDLVYQHAVVRTDLELPKILEGVARKAKKGRVDAARLALEVTGRHNPKGEQQPPNITVQIANIPRPGG